MVAMIGAGAFLVVILLSVLLICGLPLGEFTMGGQHKVFPVKLRFLLVSQLVIQMLFVIVILQLGGHLPFVLTPKITRGIGIGMAVYLSLNVVMNLISKSKKERYVMTPLSCLTAVCFWMTLFG